MDEIRKQSTSSHEHHSIVGPDVGIIPDANGKCPVGSEHIFIRTDDEDSNNTSAVSGWTGQISRYSTGTNFWFCRVNGGLFRSHVNMPYAVLKLAGSCPTGSVSMQRHFMNESNQNNNSSSGQIAPNYQGSLAGSPPQYYTDMYFCYFPGDPLNGMYSFPNLAQTYGVFAAPSPSALATGWVHTDDDDNFGPSKDVTTGPSQYLTVFSTIVHGSDYALGGKNTYFRVVKAAADTCTSPCPTIGSYDTLNCFVGGAPAGTSAFLWSNNFYYTYASGQPKCPLSGSWDDTRNCFVQAVPAGTKPFIWSNNWYVEPSCRP